MAPVRRRGRRPTTGGRVEPDVAAVLDRVTAWARGRPEVAAVALVGSQARDAARPDSDVDLVVVAAPVDALVDEDGWLDAVTPGAREIRRRRWGPLVERRMRLPTGLVVELGVVTPDWAALPLDAGTDAVLRDGVRVLYDPRGLLSRAVAARGG